MTVIDVRSIDVLGPERCCELPHDVDIWALLRCGDVPVGHTRLTIGRSTSFGEVVAGALTRVHAARALRLALAAWLERVGTPETFSIAGAFDALREKRAHEQPTPQHTPPLAVTVAICSRDRPQQLARAVEAIIGTLGVNDELLVVLNAPSNIEASFDRERFPSVRVVVEHRPGLSWARNRAIAEFHRDVLLFTDDDCVPEARWVNAHRALFARNPDVDVATGLVEPLELQTAAQQLFEAYGGFPRNYERRWITAPDQLSVASAVGNVGEYGVGANLGIRRRVFDQIGPFDAALGPGTVCRAGDDAEYLFRALKSGMLLAIEPRAVVRHEHRREMDELTKQVAGWSRGFACAIERSSRVFPEERGAFTSLRRRIAISYHARRALFHPSIASLALTEMREMRSSAAWYEQARATAKILVSDHPSPAVDAPSIRTPRDQSRTAASTIPDLRLNAHYGLTGTDRLADAKVDAMRVRMFARGWRHAIGQSLELLRAQVRASV